MAGESYYVKSGEREKGPYSVNTLRTSLRDGSLKIATLVRAEGESDWVRLDTVVEPEVAAVRMGRSNQRQSSQGNQAIIVALGIVLAVAVIVIFVRPAAQQRAAPAELDEKTQREPEQGASTLPKAPFAIAAPPEPPSQLGKLDLHTLPLELLEARASRAVHLGDWTTAVQLQHWAVARGASGQYNLACYYGRAQLVDAAIYWLQRAALDEGADADWASEDQDLEAVRVDPRWKQVRAFLVRATQYWVARAVKEAVIVLPTGYTKDRAIPLIVGLHGMGSDPANFATGWTQSTVDALGVAFVAVSGTVSLGPHKFRWAESAERDAARVEEALAELRDRLTVAEGQIVLIGFSQGAQMSAEIAARQPGRFAGAIIMSPGTQGNLALEGIAASAELAKRRFVVVGGAGEHPGTVARAEGDAARLRTLGANVFHKAYADMNTHSFPPDFEEAMPVWVRFILGTGPKP
jgi:predicted esterase